MMRKQLLGWFLGLTLVAVFAGIAAAQPAAPTLSVVGRNLDVDGLKVGTGFFRVTLAITAGADGTPYGIRIEWVKKSVYDGLGGRWPTVDDPEYASLKHCECYGPYTLNLWAGNPVMLSGERTYLQIGDLEDETGLYGNDYSQLQPGTGYVFRGFADGDPLSAPSNTVWAATATAECTQGFWKTHGPGDCHSGNNANLWPASCFPMMLGTVSYNQTDICRILNQTPGGNGLISLAHQLITAKLNICNGSNPAPISGTISSADALIGGLVIPPVGSGTLPPSQTSSLTETLDDYNNGLLGGVASCPTAVLENTTWGRIKVLYR